MALFLNDFSMSVNDSVGLFGWILNIYKTRKSGQQIGLYDDTIDVARGGL